MSEGRKRVSREHKQRREFSPETRSHKNEKVSGGSRGRVGRKSSDSPCVMCESWSDEKILKHFNAVPITIDIVALTAEQVEKIKKGRLPAKLTKKASDAKGILSRQKHAEEERSHKNEKLSGGSRGRVGRKRNSPEDPDYFESEDDEGYSRQKKREKISTKIVEFATIGEFDGKQNILERYNNSFKRGRGKGPIDPAIQIISGMSEGRKRVSREHKQRREFSPETRSHKNEKVSGGSRGRVGRKSSDSPCVMCESWSDEKILKHFNAVPITIDIVALTAEQVEKIKKGRLPAKLTKKASDAKGILSRQKHAEEERSHKNEKLSGGSRGRVGRKRNSPEDPDYFESEDDEGYSRQKKREKISTKIVEFATIGEFDGKQNILERYNNSFKRGRGKGPIDPAIQHVDNRIDPGLLEEIHKGEFFCNIFSLQDESLLRFVHFRASQKKKLNKSMLGPMLRRSKVPGCGNQLQKMLAEKKIYMCSNTKKGAAMCTLTSLYEEEALVMAADSRELALKSFPYKALVHYFIGKCKSRKQLVQRRAKWLATLRFMRDMKTVAAEYKTIEASTAKESPFTKFALSSHHFGMLEWTIWMDIVTNYTTYGLEQAALELAKGPGCNWASEQAVIKKWYPEFQPFNFTSMSSKVDKFDSEAFVKLCNLGNQNLGELKPLHAFTETPARMSIDSVKYYISVGEILRRFAPPEEYSLYMMDSYMRKSKTLNHAAKLLDALEARGICVPEGRRMKSSPNTFTAVLEEEADTLARDIRGLAKAFFPRKYIALRILNLEHSQLENNKKTNIDPEKKEAIKSVLTELMETTWANRLPTCGHISNFSRPALEHFFAPFSLSTHGFGPLEACTWLSVFVSMLNNQIDMMKGDSTGSP